MRKLIASLILFAVLLVPLAVRAQIDDIDSGSINLGAVGVDTPSSGSLSTEERNYISDWYIKDFKSDIVVNSDGSLNITEDIVADCGDLSGKHGIFRILPQKYYPKSFLSIPTPVELISITDFEGKPYTYSTDLTDGNISWKIGDPNTTVQGINNYRIKYKVLDTIRGSDPNFDEFYWNLNGNFWDIETDAYSAKITFPVVINQMNIKEINTYLGSFGAKNANSIKTIWTSPNVLQVNYPSRLGINEGITLSVTFPKGLVVAHKISFGDYLKSFITEGLVWALLPILVFLLCFYLWNKYGKDPKLNKSITPEFDVPDKLTPMELGAFLKNAELQTSNISAEIVNLAVGGIIKIEDIPKKGIFSSADTKLTITGTPAKVDKLSAEDKLLLNSLFGSASEGQELLISSLKNNFYKKIPAIKSAVKDKQIQKGLFSEKGFSMRDGMVVIGILAAMGSFYLFSLAIIMPLSIIISAASIIIFGILMPRRTEAGADLLWRIRGFELYMKTAEKYRQKFNEKENIFERFLPYAMVFGIVDLWTRKMKEIYGEEYFNSYHPVWYVGAFNLNNGVFDVDNFTSQLNSISSDMSSSMSSSPSSSGSGGGGFSGGGGGGGGGGGW